MKLSAKCLGVPYWQVGGFFWEVKYGFSPFKVAVLEAHTMDS